MTGASAYSNCHRTATAAGLHQRRRPALIVLRHELRRRLRPAVGVAQQGHRGNARAMPTMRRRRMLAMELGTWRSGRSGGASGSVTRGNGRLREEDFAARVRGGNGAPLGDQEAVGGDAHGGVMVEASPASPFEVAEPDLLLEVLIIALDAPAHHGDVDEAVEGDVPRQRGEPEFRRRLLALRPLDQQPFLGLVRACSPRRGRAHARVRSASASGSAEPSRHVIVCHARFGRPAASRLGRHLARVALAGLRPASWPRRRPHSRGQASQAPRRKEASDP